MGSGDRYYGYGPIAGVCTAVITNLFSPVPSPPANVAKNTANGLRNEHGYLSPPPSAESSPQIGADFAPSAAAPAAKAQWQAREGIDTPPHSPVVSESGKEIPELMDFIAYALYRTRLPTPIIHSALVLLTRLKKLYPSARGTSSSPHRLFLSALMLASKMSMDDTYSNRSWCIVGQQLFALAEVNRMERELFGFLNWNCCVSGDELDAWTEEWLAPNGIVGHAVAQAGEVEPRPTASARRSSEDRKRRRSSTSGSSKDAHPQQKPSPPFTTARPEDASVDRHRQATDAARALLHPSSAAAAAPSRSSSLTVDSPIGPTERRASAPTLPQSASAPSVFQSSSQQSLVSPPSPDSPPRARAPSQRRSWSASRVNDSMHMRQSSDSSMRSLASSACCDSSDTSFTGSVCCSSISSPRSYQGSDSPASAGLPRTPEEATDTTSSRWSSTKVDGRCSDEAAEDRPWYGRAARQDISAGGW